MMTSLYQKAPRSLRQVIPTVSSLTVMLIIVLGLPWWGAYLMEQGALGLNILQTGAPNGVTLAYGWYLLVGGLIYMVLYTHLRPMSRQRRAVYTTRRAMRRVASIVIIVELMALVFLYAGAGASQVLGGQSNKGEFRSGLGGLGPLAFFLRDFFCPMLCALVGWVWRRCPGENWERFLFGMTVLLTATYSALWGYKTAALQALVPTVIVVWPRLRLTLLLTFAALACIAAVGFALLFDSESLADAVNFVMWRATVGSGDTLWRLWDLRLQNDAFPPYLPTWLEALGGRLGAVIADLSRSNADQLMQTQFAALATVVVKDYDPGVNALTSNVTSTAFGEGIIALGSPGYLVFAALAGVIVAVIRAWLERALVTERPLLTVFLANYMGFSVMSWLTSGGLITLLNVPHLISYGVAALAGALVLGHAGLGRLRLR